MQLKFLGRTYPFNPSKVIEGGNTDEVIKSLGYCFTIRRCGVANKQAASKS